MPERICANCGNTIVRNSERLFPENVKTFFCNNKCTGEYTKRTRVRKPCGNCGKMVERRLSCFTRSKSGEIYCCPTCTTKGNRAEADKLTKHKTSCGQCGKELVLNTCRMKEKNFCTKSCAGKYSAANGNRKANSRSKFEKWMESELITMYPGMKILFNSRKELGGKELDIYFPDLKLGIEINGPTHWIPIYGEDLLERVRANDLKKIQTCSEKEIVLIVLDTRKQNAFSETSKLSIKYRSAILEQINERLRFQIEPMPNLESKPAVSPVFI